MHLAPIFQQCLLPVWEVPKRTNNLIWNSLLANKNKTFRVNGATEQVWHVTWYLRALKLSPKNVKMSNEFDTKIEQQKCELSNVNINKTKQNQWQQQQHCLISIRCQYTELTVAGNCQSNIEFFEFSQDNGVKRRQFANMCSAFRIIPNSHQHSIPPSSCMWNEDFRTFLPHSPI